jgi:hypothetical protein
MELAGKTGLITGAGHDIGRLAAEPTGTVDLGLADLAASVQAARTGLEQHWRV